MRLPRIVAAASAFLLACCFALFQTGTAGAAGPGYVALGDSYSAGVGAGSYIGSSGSCSRSTKAYPYLWAAAHAPSSFAFAACGGAKTGDVLKSQLSSLTPTTGLVSITIGGNDAGFSDVMTTCVTGSDSTCVNRIDQARAYAQNTLPALLDNVYSAISAKSPAAHVVVLGYPRFYQIDGDCLLGLSDTKRQAIDDAADLLDGVIAKRAADHGFTFGDVRAAFAPHEICSSGVWWLHSLTYPVSESYHPTAAGQSGGYLPVFTAAAG
ncbi:MULTISPECIES: SGNH/GDSL hydrolase family protein [Streptomycetaceae]|uniref:SGNH/GDSL hydrolase family protein n=1 Tax=Streptomycetaceae TaxID=2062 RepID=UPI000213EA24|nr:MULTISPECIES: SGNH/GDSL hydrolase family protein [Streptomycetaceae]MYS58012.1 lipase [Streptomyces sp. SID5468]CCB73653.1 Lipase [Streptantibioticus cattleyicolor NRRL 8057 = DSM 46488]